MTNKPYYNKHKCVKCIYHGLGCGGYSVKINEDEHRPIYCNYAGVTGETCLKRDGDKVIDLRGDDYNHCKLYVKGKAKKSKGDLEEVV